MNRLRSNQIFAILLVSAAFPLLCRTDAFTIEGIFGAAIAAVVQLLLCLPMLRLYFTPAFPFAITPESTASCPFSFWRICSYKAASPLSASQSTSQDLALPFSGKFLAAALIALVCLYTVSLGIQALARSSTVILGILILTLILMCIGAIPQGRTGRTFPFRRTTPSGVAFCTA